MNLKLNQSDNRELDFFQFHCKWFVLTIDYLYYCALYLFRVVQKAEVLQEKNDIPSRLKTVDFFKCDRLTDSFTLVDMPQAKCVRVG